MSGRHPSLEKLSRERLRFQRLAMSSPSEFVASPMTELAANLNDVAHIMSPDSRRRLSMDSSSPGTPLSTITNLVRNPRGKIFSPLVSNPGVSSVSTSSPPFNKENHPLLSSESEDESSKDSGFCGLHSAMEDSASSRSLSRENSTSINETLAELRSRPESEPLASLPEDSPCKSDGFDLREHEDFDLDQLLLPGNEENAENESSSPKVNISTLITNKVVLSPRNHASHNNRGLRLAAAAAAASSSSSVTAAIVRPKPFDASPSPRALPFRRSLSLLVDREGKAGSRKCLLDSSHDMIISPVSRLSTFKRPSSPQGDRSLKRRKIYEAPGGSASPKVLNRSLSEVSFSSLISAGLSSSADLTGDMSRPVLFPIVPPGSEVKHHDLKPIDADTLARLMRGEFQSQVESFRIIDARYVYEFEGGHIRGAENFGSWNEGAFFDEFLPVSKKPLAKPYPLEAKRTILIFHCEFSSVRGPELMKKLRQKDRCLNRDTYPALYYPECYLLHKGYKEFFRLYPELCEPQSYRSMADPNYQKDAKAFHKKSKSWAGGTVARTRQTSRPLNL
eukprot:TRINITY_DN506_c2_g1_i1.p1 TRINITY_DN506_c2_g1~~TRINITY_DN506_c2_g1_i1.p1  ORF type:complete len:563 (+),score=201.18 TRINITY_DN506_c2_g1_i1:98-1786(+)